MSQAQAKSVDIVLPLYNEEKVLALTVERLVGFLAGSGFPYPYVITLANNASVDGSENLCAELAKKYRQVRFLNLSRKGKGLAVRTAWAKSDADILSFMDVDLASDLAYFRPLIDAVASHRADLAIGNRLGKNSVITDRRLHREVMSRFYNFLVRLFLRTGLDDHQCGFKAIGRAAFRQILPDWREDGFFFDTELIALLRRAGFRILSIDIRWNDKRESKVSFLHDSMKMFTDLISLRRRLNSK